MCDVLHFAFEYYDRGWSLIPLVGKRPAKGFCWKQFQSERATLDDVKRWFKSPQDGFSNIGIVTGAVSGITVVDCDTPDDAAWWSKSFPVSPLASNTGRGGAHFYYRADPSFPIGNRANVFGRNIDIRGDGGYVCGPPSVHPATYVVYDWQPWNHYALNDIPQFDPAWLGPPRSHTFAAVSSTLDESSHPVFSRQAPDTRSAEEILRYHSQPQQVRHVVSRLNWSKKDRSKRDYAIVCELIRLGVRDTDIWSLVRTKSKFATDGWRYFVTTFRNASHDVATSNK